MIFLAAIPAILKAGAVTVAHSSGGTILTGTAGYVAQTYTSSTLGSLALKGLVFLL